MSANALRLRLSLLAVYRDLLISDCYRRSIACNGRCPSQQCKHCCLQIVRFAGGVQVRCPQKKKKHEQSSCLSFCGAVYAKQMVLTHLVRCTDTACLFVYYVRCAQFLQMLCACSSLCLRSTETCSEQSERNSGTGEYYSPK